MKPIQYYIGILSVLGYVYCLPVVGQVEDKVVRKGNPRLEYTDVKTGRSPEGKMFTVSFNIVESINRLRTQEIVYIYPSQEVMYPGYHPVFPYGQQPCIFSFRKYTKARKQS